MTDSSIDPQAITAASRHFIIGTAGHIDHGKTSLVRALTGINTDRLPEEQRRGMTIELGFAALTIGDTQFGVVDVPGHERFIRTMVSGATGIDIAVLVVAADDSVMPQTVEHVEILNLLGVTRAVVALTKIDMVDSTMVELASEEIREHLAGTALASAPICPVSSVTGAGLTQLKNSILEVSNQIPLGNPRPPFRMAIDRVFTVQGRGTVVTGSVLRGTVTGGDALELWPRGRTLRVRDLQTHGVSQSCLIRGQRAAINLSGVDRDELSRGDELATPGYLRASRLLDVRLEILRSGQPLRSSRRARMEMGAREIPVRVVLLEGELLPEGQSGYAQLRAGRPMTAVYGQRFILRDEAATRTLGGGVVLRPIGVRKRRTAEADIDALRRLETGSPTERVAEVLRSAGFASVSELQLSARGGVELNEIPAIFERLQQEKRWITVPGSDVHFVPEVLKDLEVRFGAWLERHHRDHPELPGRPLDAVLGWLERVTGQRSLARPLLDDFQEKGIVKTTSRFVASPAFAPSLSAADEKLLAAMIDQIRTGRFQPPTLPELAASKPSDRKRFERLATLAVAQGELVSIGSEIYLHADVERDLRRIVADRIAQSGGATVAQIREALQSSRKFVVPFVEYLDRVGCTKRVGDARVLVDCETK